MLSAAAALFNRFAWPEAMSRRDAAALATIALLHIAALGTMAVTEVDLLSRVAFLLAWAVLNCFWLALFKRPAIAAVLSLMQIVVLIMMSQCKHEKLRMSVNFVDLMQIDQDTATFLVSIMPRLRVPIALGVIVTVPLVVLAWRLDPFRVRRWVAVLGGALAFSGLAVLSLLVPTELYDEFFAHNYVSKFARTGVEALYEVSAHGLLQSDATATEQLKSTPLAACNPAGKLPHIILLHDESSFDITVAPGIKVPPGYQNHFRSFDGAARKLVVEGAGGPSWFTEYNVLTGLSARSYGRFATSATRIAAGRVMRGLPRSLTRCQLRDFQPLSVLRRLSRLARFPDHGRDRPLYGHGRSRHA